MHGLLGPRAILRRWCEELVLKPPCVHALLVFDLSEMEAVIGMRSLSTVMGMGCGRVMCIAGGISRSAMLVD
jgi:hypothetical protein